MDLGWMDEWLDRCMNGWLMADWLDDQMDRWMDEMNKVSREFKEENRLINTQCQSWSGRKGA